MPTVLITGANRGLGLEFCKQYSAKNWQVIACCRCPETADALKQLSQQDNDLVIHSLDLADFNQINALPQKLDVEKIDVLINNAGVYGDKAGQGLGNIDYQAWQDSLQINVQAPVCMIEMLLPKVKKSDKKLLVSISSLMGSMADNTSGSSYLYRSSKAALNAVMKSIAIDLKSLGVGVITFHPGWVLTDMGGPNALITSEMSVRGMIEQIDQFEMRLSGSFIKYDGTELPW